MKQPFTLSFDDTEIAFAYQSDKALKKARWIFDAMHYGWLVKLGSMLAPWALKLHLPIQGLIKRTVFGHFCGGETLEEAGATAGRLAAFGVGVILDYGVEAAEDEASYDAAVREFIQAVDYAAIQSNIPFISLKVSGFAHFGLLEKLHRGEALLPGETEAYGRVRKRIYAICERAAQSGIGVLIDAEESWIQHPVDQMAEEMMIHFNAERPVVFNTFQLYLHSRKASLRKAHEKAQAAGYVLGAKLVRGAYLEKEGMRAEAQGYPSPLQPSKEATDRAFDEAMVYCMDHLKEIAVFIGSHNERSCRLAARLLHEKDLAHDHPHVHFSQLYGMSDNLTFNLSKAGYRVSKYVPYGPVREVMPYLIRRAQENASISGQLGREQRLIHQELRRRNLL